MHKRVSYFAPSLFVFFVMLIQIDGFKFVAYATDHGHSGLALLNQTARWHGWSPLHIIGSNAGFNKHGLVDKLRALRRYARRCSDDTIVVFVDGYDVIVNTEPALLEVAFIASGKRVLISSEVGCCTDKPTALQYKNTCHGTWPFAGITGGRQWLNSGVIVGYARDIEMLLDLAWEEYATSPAMYRAYTDQQLLCFLMSDGSTIWTRASVGIDHYSHLALNTYRTDITIGSLIGIDVAGRVVFANRTIPPIIHFNGPKEEKAQQMQYAETNFPLLQACRNKEDWNHKSRLDSSEADT